MVIFLKKKIYNIISRLVSQQLPILVFSLFSLSNAALLTSNIKGITVGGWLVTEPYITPSLYKNAMNLSSSSDLIVDEYHIGYYLSYSQASSLLKTHLDTWITEADFQKIAQDGFNLVRIPIGYWAWKDNNSADSTTSTYLKGKYTYKDYFINVGQLQYLENALIWCEKYGLKAWIDLHGVPGSQNGFDNSGQRILNGPLGWLSTDVTNTLTTDILTDIFQTFLNGNKTYQDVVAGIEIVNEPLHGPIPINDVIQFYYKSLANFQQYYQETSNTTLIIHDAFEGLGFWNEHFNVLYKNVSSQYTNDTSVISSSKLLNDRTIIIDHHHYEVFTDGQLINSPYQRIRDIISYGDSLQMEQGYHPSVVGEWSGAITDCATWLNGVGIGSRYDGSYYGSATNFTTTSTGIPVGKCQSQLSVENWSSSYKTSVRQFIETQLVQFGNKSAGWIFWNWKTENAVEWDYLKLKEAKLFPHPFDDYKYYNKKDGSMKSSFQSQIALATSTDDTYSNKAVKLISNNGMNLNSIMKILLFLNIPLAITFLILYF
ncbi:related to Glucan 1,3-beta-glucosidase 2 [Saccharomycodes ludwigii]|uniref:Related to Glucan 1,3-beta-glucosidase 2 n=1 Tax=Saccharomycodes ludwigii TaxID=36035 RepID=A0A376B4M9_9ASCO|nr:hypothetical protein SCDLUD_004881 [Saccharomycodes ludwigii]KAH3899438.1 hypothetical protein SCDLUD_004881 [Saccharomycodes ludwigii]SSD59623.1 related to Glucan 1,3-beta-glucosidase 2 [Saccharomycodes ludwigii]